MSTKAEKRRAIAQAFLSSIQLEDEFLQPNSAIIVNQDVVMPISSVAPSSTVTVLGSSPSSTLENGGQVVDYQLQMSSIKRKQLATSFLTSLIQDASTGAMPEPSDAGVNLNINQENQGLETFSNFNYANFNAVVDSQLQSSSDGTPVLQKTAMEGGAGSDLTLPASVSSTESVLAKSNRFNQQYLNKQSEEPKSSVHPSQMFDSMNSQFSLGSTSSRVLGTADSMIMSKNHSNDLVFNSDHVRMFITSQSTNTPLSLVSILKFHDEKRRKKKRLAAEVNRILDMTGAKKSKAESFVQYLLPAAKPMVPYDPLKLDDPNLKTGRHRTIITLPSYISSIIEYARPSELKKELNELFRIQHPDLNESLSLSKIRNLKTNLLEVALAENLELSTVAKAYVYFEKLVFQNFVKKQNRKLIGAICLVLASKINDSKDVNYASLLRSLEKDLWITQKEIRENEFEVFVRLEFDLHIPQEEYMPHLERLVSQLDYYSVQEYLSGKPPPNQQLQYIK